MSQNIFKVVYMHQDGTQPPVEVESYVVIPTWEELVAYVHEKHGTLLSATTVNCWGNRVNVLTPSTSIPPQEGA